MVFENSFHHSFTAHGSYRLTKAISLGLYYALQPISGSCAARFPVGARKHPLQDNLEFRSLKSRTNCRYQG
jgi:hypothetical protein